MAISTRTLPRSSRKTSLIASPLPFVTLVTSADTQACSLSSNQTLVPLLYMFSAIQWASVVVVVVGVENDAACPCPTMSVHSDVVPRCDGTTVTMYILTTTCFSFFDHMLLVVT